ncbi:MAG: 5'-nucleotidase C-terminal domain-containing protein, partial [Bacillota bacterium]
KDVRSENPNTLVVDNGDTVQGTILTDDLYNLEKIDEPNPIINIMNEIGYDAMVLGNHEFNFGLDLIKKIRKEANFPILSANTYYKDDGSNFVDSYIIKEVEGVKVGILGLTVPSIPRWDGPKVKPLEFKHMAKEAKKYSEKMRDEGADVIFVAAHAGLETRHESDGSDAAKLIAEQADVDALLVGHDHSNVNKMIDDTLVLEPKANYGHAAEVAKFDLSLEKNDGKWTVVDKKGTTISISDYEEDKDLDEIVENYHENVIEFLNEPIGKAEGTFHPESEVPGIPTAQIQDTPVIDLINNVQLKYTDADVSAAALFKPSSNIEKGDVTYADIFNIYKYPNTLYAVEMTGKELKDYMEWSASFFNTHKPGDLTISFDPEIRGYNYDMFQGVDYDIDISEKPGDRIKNLTMDGKKVTDDQVIKVAINNYRFGGLTSMGIISNEAYMKSDPKSLRSYIKDYIQEKGTIEPTVDNNWEIIGADLDHPMRDEVIEKVKEGKIEIPTSEDGRTANVKSLNIYDLKAEGKIDSEGMEKITLVHTNDTHSRIKEGKYAGMGFAKISTVINQLEKENPNTLILDAGDAMHGQVIGQLNEGKAVVDVMNAIGYDAMTAGNHDFNYGYDRLLELNEMTNFPILAANVSGQKMKDYMVKAGDMLYKIAQKNNVALEKLIKNNPQINNPDLILPGDKIHLSKGESANLNDYIIKEIAGKKVAIFGLATPETTWKTHPKNVENVVFEKPIQKAKQMVDKLEGKADVIIALSHLGIDKSTKDEYRSDILAQKVDGIDILVDGHSHDEVNKMINDTLIVQAGEYDKNLGIVDLYIEGNELVHKNARLLTKDEVSDVKQDQKILDTISEIEKENEKITSKVIGKTDKVLDGKRENVRTGQTNLGNMLATAMMDKTDADIALTNGGGIRASIDKGEITRGEVITVLPFGNIVVTKELTGKQIISALENGLSGYPENHGAFPHIAGMEVKFDGSKEAGNRVTNVIINGKKLQENKKYSVATNDFIAAGGDEYTMFKGTKTLGEYGGLDEILGEWIRENGTKGAEIDDRIIEVSEQVSLLLLAA